MCDDTLDASNENLLSRLSKLEDMVALGGIPSKPVIVEEKPKQETEKTIPVPETKLAPAPQSTNETPKMKGLSCWAEVIDRVSQSDNRSASYLKQTRAFVVGDSIKVYVPDPFTLMMIDGSGAKDSLRAALSICLKREVRDNQLAFELAPDDLPEDDSVLDSLMMNFDN